MTALPRPIDESAVTPDAFRAAVLGWARQVDEYLRLQPTQEEIRFLVDPADLPLLLEVQTAQVRGVVRMGSRIDGGADVPDTGISWQQSERQDETGIVLAEIEGCSAGTTYEITLLVIGKRD